jgi:hypothetical protein
VSIESDLFAALSSLVGGRVYPITFPQTSGTPGWPAIRYTFISITPDLVVCGDTGDIAADTRVQLDLVASTYVAARVLRLQVMAVMQTFLPPAIFETNFETWDAETKTFRASLDYVIQKSSEQGSP